MHSARKFIRRIAVLGVFCALAAPGQDSLHTLVGQATRPGPGGEGFAAAGAMVTLSSVSGAPEEGAEEPTAETDELGIFRFEGVAEGCYIATATAAGLIGQTDIFCAPQAEGERITLTMELEIVSTSISVTATQIGIDTTETSSTGSLGSGTMYDAPKANKRVEDVMPLIPGVVRGPSGEINMNGARTSQGGFQLNGADMTDPVTRTAQLSIPLEAVSTVEVLSSPFDAEFGGFAGAMSMLETKPANFDDLKVTFQNFGLRPRRRNGGIQGIESWTPRLTMTGPLKKGKVAFLHSTEYQFVITDQEDANLPILERDIEREALTMYTEFDVQHSDVSSTRGTILIYPEKLNHFGLNAFTNQRSTPDLRRRGFAYTLRHMTAVGSGGTLISKLLYQDLESDVKPLTDLPTVIGFDSASGGFFNRQARNTIRRKWEEMYRFAPVSWRGQHAVKAGFALSAEAYHGNQTYNPITWLGTEDRPAFQTLYGPPAAVRAAKNDLAFFVQDKWSPTDKLTFDLGVRAERDSIARTWNPSYRSGFAYAFGGDTRTVLRGGVGLFYDRISLVVPTFEALPGRVDLPPGLLGGPLALRGTNQLSGPIENPRTLAWSMQLEREVLPDLFLRAGYQQRRTTRNFVVSPRDPLALGEPATFLSIANSGKDSYQEWQLTMRYRLGDRGHITGSYVRSNAVGDLNDLGSIFGPTPAALVRDNERAPLSFNIPNRLLVWTEFGLPFGARAVPILEVRDGFPYSDVDELRRFVGPRNRAGKFPVYNSMDLQLTRVVKFEMKGKQRRIRIGVRMFNLMNNFNPRDVQNNIASPHYGTFYRGTKRKIRAVFEFGT